MKLVIIIAVVAVLGVVAFIFLRRSGYRGAVGFKNRHASEIATIRLTGFSEPEIAARWRTASTPSISWGGRIFRPRFRSRGALSATQLTRQQECL